MVATTSIGAMTGSTELTEWIASDNLIAFLWALATLAGTEFDESDALAVETAMRSGSVSYPVAPGWQASATQEDGTAVTMVTVRLPDSQRSAVGIVLALMQEFVVVRAT